MNKKLMAVAVAGALAAPGLAVAQATFSPQGSSPAPFAPTGVQIYGRLDETIMNTKYSAVQTNAAGTTNVLELKKGDIYSPGNAMGVRGREDLGGGTSLWFQLEAGVWPSERTEAGATTGVNFGGRNSGIGVSSDLGDIMLGIWDTPYKVVFGTWNSLTSGGFSTAGVLMGNGDTTGSLNNALCTNTVNNGTGNVTISNTPGNALNTNNSVCVTESTANGTAFSRRMSNSVQYWSPVFSGLQFKLMTSLANYQSPGNVQFSSGVPKAKEYSANVTWARGPLSLGLGYDAHQGLRPNTTAGAVTGNANPKDTAYQLGAKWNFGVGEVGVGYEKISYGDNAASNQASTKMDVATAVVNGRFGVGPGALWASYGKSPGGKSCVEVGSPVPGNATGAGVNGTTIGSASCGIEAKQMTFGYDYIMSKRTKMYIAYNKIDNGLKVQNGGIAGTSYYYIAGPAANSGNGTSGGLTAGTDVTTLGVGIQHLF
jgi:predicted porin